MAEKNLDTALDYKLKGNELYKSNNFEGAIELYTKALDNCPSHRKTEMAIMYQNRAAANERLESLDAAKIDCDSSLQCNNRYGKALDRRAKVLRKLATKLGGTDQQLESRVTHLKQALEDMSMCCQLEGYKQDQLMFVDGLLKELGSASAILAVKNRKADLPSGHTIQQYFTSFTKDPFMSSEEGDSPFYEAKKYYQQGEFEKIIDCCDKEMSESLAKQLEAKLTKATFLILSRQHSTAMDLLSEVIDESNDNKAVKVNALIKRGALHIQKCLDPTKDAENSLNDFNQALEIDSESADVYMNMGQVKLLLDKFEEAVHDLNRACTLRPDFALAHVQKLYTDFLAGQATNNQDKIKTAMADFEAAIVKFPDCVEAYALYAKVLQERFEFEKADNMYKKGSDLNPKNGNLVIHRALLKLQRDGDVESTVKEINKAISIDEKNEFAHETLGQLEIQRENYEAAADHFSKAIPLVNTELEMAHLFGLMHSAQAKVAAKKKLSEIPTGMHDLGLD